MNLWNLLNKKVTGATHKKAINVPITPNKKIYIKYLKNDLLFKLYPAPKIINGRIYVKKILSENASEFVKSDEGEKIFISKVIIIPSNITIPDSCI